jgi:hypothetical protein
MMKGNPLSVARFDEGESFVLPFRIVAKWLNAMLSASMNNAWLYVGYKMDNYIFEYFSFIIRQWYIECGWK